MFRDPKKKKKDLWTEITRKFAERGYSVTPDMLDRKFRNMTRTFKQIKDNNKKSTTGTGRINWEYFEAFEKMFEVDRSVNFQPPIASSNFLNFPSTSTSNSITSNILSDPVLELNSSQFEQNIATPLTNPEHTRIAKEKKTGSKRLQEYRKNLLQTEISRVNEIKKLREAIEQSNDIQKERNQILLQLVTNTKPQ